MTEILVHLKTANEKNLKKEERLLKILIISLEPMFAPNKHYSSEWLGDVFRKQSVIFIGGKEGSKEKRRVSEI